MADAARALLSKIVLEQDIVSALNAGIRPDWFEDDEPRRVFTWMLDYFSRYQSAPTRTAIRLEFPNYRLIRTDEPYEYYTDRFRHKRRFAITADTIITANDLLGDDDVDAAVNALAHGLTQATTEVGSFNDHNVVEWQDSYDEYQELRKEVGELTGIPTGFGTYDLITGGFHPEQFILFAGAAKQGKSWMLMKSAIAAHDYGKKVLFITFEMSLREQKARYHAMTCGLNSNTVLQATFSDKDMTKLKRGMKVRANLEPFIISADITATTTPSGLAGKIEEHQPDVIYVDGIHLMDNEIGAESLTPQAYTSLSRSFKRLAQRIRKPVVGTIQALTSKMDKTRTVTLHSLGYTSSWSQDADLIFGAERDPVGPIINLRIAGGRNVSPEVIAIHCDWEESIFDEWDGEEDDAEQNGSGSERRSATRSAQHRRTDGES
jgi:replicative DNA helicase